jgi:Transposase DDE domain
VPRGHQALRNRWRAGEGLKRAREYNWATDEPPTPEDGSTAENRSPYREREREGKVTGPDTRAGLIRITGAARSAPQRALVRAFLAAFHLGHNVAVGALGPAEIIIILVAVKVAKLWAAEWAKEGKKVDWQRLMPPGGFRVLPRRWVVERTFAWISHNRRMSKDYERLCATGEAFVYVAMTRLMVRRLARA